MTRGIGTLLIFTILSLTQCDRRGTSSDYDHVAPAAIENLAATALSPTEAELSWTATGDDDLRGRATEYRIVYSATIFFVEADTDPKEWPNPPAPAISGTVQRCTISGLSPDSTYWFAIYAYDDNRNRSPISNVTPRAKVDPVGLSITKPINNEHLAETVIVTVSDSGNIPLAGVWLYIDNVKCDSLANPPWNFNWNTAGLPHGSTHSLWATSRTTNGDQYFSDTVTVTIDSTKAIPTLPGRFRLVTFSDHHAEIVWNHNQDDDFLFYRLAWQANGNASIIDSAIIYARLDTTLVITELSGLTDYKATLTIGDKTNHLASTTLEFRTLDSIPPVLAITDLCREGSFATRLTWEQPHLYDFAQVEVYRSIDSLPDNSDQLVASITDPDQTVIRDAQYDFSSDIYYYLKLVDNEQLASVSSVVRLPACMVNNFALRFDGINDLAVIPYNGWLYRSSDMTLEMWVWMESRSPAQAIFCQQVTYMEMVVNGESFRWGTAGCVQSQYRPILPERQWFHLAIVRDYDQRAERIFIDGVFYGERSCDEWKMAHTDLYLGALQNKTGYFKGMIDEVRVWDRALSWYEIEETRFATHIGQSEHLVGYWTFDEGGGEASYSGIGLPAVLGIDGSTSSDDPDWVVSTVPTH